MPKINVSKSIEINAPQGQVINVLKDFKQWHKWSPWLIQDPDCSLNYAADGQSYEWDSHRIGSGNMHLKNISDEGRLDYDLTFLKPWKSSSKVNFSVTPHNNSTKVEWAMQSTLPFFMFFMRKMMKGFIGMDYDRGLLMLKDYVETGQVPSRLSFIGEEDYAGCSFIGIKTSTSKDKIGPKMSADLERIWHFIEDKQDLISGPPFSIYHKWDMSSGGVTYTSGLPVSKIPENLPEGIFGDTIPAMKVFTIEHTGPYRHLGNGWSTLYGMGRNKEFKMDKKGVGFETYLNDPSKVSENDLITRIHYPIKN